MSNDDVVVLKDPKGCTNHELVLECFSEEVLTAAISRLQGVDSPSWEVLLSRATDCGFRPFNRFLKVLEDEDIPSDFDLMVKLFPDFEELALKLKADKPEVWAEMLVRAARGHLAYMELVQQRLAETFNLLTQPPQASHGFTVFSCWGGST